MTHFQSEDKCREIIAKDLENVPEEYKKFNDVTRNNRDTNPWKKVIIGIVTCKKYNSRYQNFLSLFADIFKEFGIEYYAIVADPDIEVKDGLDYSIDRASRTFTAKANESYETLAHKLAIFYSYVNNYTDFEYIVKVDDGCLLNMSRILYKPEFPYAGSALKPTSNKCHFNKCSSKEYNKTLLDFGHNFKEFNPNMTDELYESLYHIRYAGGGYGYRLHRDAFQHIDKYKAHILSLGLSYEDTIFGQILHLEGVNVSYHGIGRYHYISVK